MTEEWQDDDSEMLTITAGGPMDGPARPQPLPPLPVLPRMAIQDAAPQPIPREYGGAGRIQLPVNNLSPWDQPQPSLNLTGPFDAWAAKVTQVLDVGTVAESGQAQEIGALRSGVTWDGTTNAPTVHEIPQAGSQPTSAIASALPFPVRHDQKQYIAAVGDCVTILSGRDGRCWYLADDLPFIARIIRFDQTASIKEDAAGGAGLKWVKVRRQLMTGDPTAAVPTHGDLHVATAHVEYAYVEIVGPDSQHHGYRVGDWIMVQRRGLYYYATPAKESFLAYSVAVGPDSEEDFGAASNFYWMKEVDGTAVYTNNGYTLSVADRSATDPMTYLGAESGGTKRRWVQAVNLHEGTPAGAGTHVMPAGTHCTVTMFADPVDGEAYYTFEWSPPLTSAAHQADHCIAVPTSPTGTPTYVTDKTAEQPAGEYVHGHMYLDGDGKLNPVVPAVPGPAGSTGAAGPAGSTGAAGPAGSTGAAGNGYQQYADVWVRITADTAKTYIDTQDWRGRWIIHNWSLYDGEVAASRADKWTLGYVYFYAAMFGDGFDSDDDETQDDERLGYYTFDAGGGNIMYVDWYCERDTGKIYIVVSGFAVWHEVQFRFLFMGSAVKTAPDLTIS